MGPRARLTRLGGHIGAPRPGPALPPPPSVSPPGLPVQQPHPAAAVAAGGGGRALTLGLLGVGAIGADVIKLCYGDGGQVRHPSGPGGAGPVGWLSAA